jgi:hypothetical protein
MQNCIYTQSVLSFLAGNSVMGPSIQRITVPNSKVSRSHVATDGQTDSISRCQAHSGTCDQILHVLSVQRLLSESWVLSLWGALSNERSGLSFVILSL